MKRIAIAALSGLLLPASIPSHAFVVNDPVHTNVSLMSWTKQAADMGRQYSQLRQQYDQLRQQYAAITGHYGRGAIGFIEAVTVSSIVPGSWQDVVAMQKRGAFASKQNYYEALIRTLPDDIFQDRQGRDATTYRMSTNSVRAALAGGDALYDEVQVHLNNLGRLGRLVDSTVNIKDAQDLQNRIATENGLLQTALARTQVMNMNLQANLLNQQNQADGANRQFFKWK